GRRRAPAELPARLLRAAAAPRVRPRRAVDRPRMRRGDAGAQDLHVPGAGHMRRRTGHAIFAAASAALLVLLASQWVRLSQAERVDRAIARAAEPGAADRALPEARFAHALALARAGRYEAAVAAQKSFIAEQHGQMARAMQYDLGNLHLREALKK